MEYSETYLEYQKQIQNKYEQSEILPVIKAHKAYVKDIINNQAEMYDSLRFYDQNHETTQIQSLSLCVAYLKFGLDIPMINSMCEENLILENLRNSVLCSILSVSANPESNYLYAPTIRVIGKILDFYDIIIRTITKVPAYYHKYRYERYIEYCLSREDLFMFPVFTSVGATDLLKLRPFPIFPIGLNITLEHVDEYAQSPIEFFIHDINHVRRMYESNLDDMQKRGINIENPQDRRNYYQESYLCLNNVLSILNNTIKTKSKDENVSTITIPSINNAKVVETSVSHLNMTDYSEIKDETPIDIGYAQIIKIIVFEITHEDALPMQQDIICETILRNSGIEVEFPRLSTDTDKISVVKNIEKGGSILGFVKYKLRYGFFDPIHSPLDYVVKHYYRTDRQLSIAVQILLTKLCNNPIPNNSLEHDRILINITDKSGLNVPNHPDLLELYIPEIINNPTFGDLTDEEVNALRQKNNINIENIFSGIRPQPVTEQGNLLKKVGGNTYKRKLNKRKLNKYKTSKQINKTKYYTGRKN